jgi:hypothetical protein
MSPSKDLAQVVTDELLQLRTRVQALLSEGHHPASDANDAYVSALIGHLFVSLLTGFGPGLRPIDRSPEALASALRTIGKKVSVVAGSLDPAAEYRIDILRRDFPSP